MFTELEGGLDFSRFVGLGEGVVAAHSIAYYVVFPLLLLAVVIGLLFRREITPFRVLTLGLAFSYLIALVFFIVFPVPERWAFPPADALLLSDAWSTRWVELYRSFRALDNSFPSLPAAFSLVMIFVCFRYRSKFRYPVFFLGSAVILSSFTLGIHWLPDILMGGFLGVFSASLAVLSDHRIVDTINISGNGDRGDPDPRHQTGGEKKPPSSAIAGNTSVTSTKTSAFGRTVQPYYFFCRKSDNLSKVASKYSCE